MSLSKTFMLSKLQLTFLSISNQKPHCDCQASDFFSWMETNAVPYLIDMII